MESRITMESRIGARSSLTCWAGACMCVHMILMVGSSQARTLQLQEASSHIRRLQAYTDGTKTAMHGPAVKSFKVSDGGWVDCVRIEEQIAAHHPALKNHIIQTMPPSNPKWLKTVGVRPAAPHPQKFGREHGGCPEGAIPVQRRDPKQPLLTKNQSPRFKDTAGRDATETPASPASASPVGAHEYAIGEMPLSPGAYGGAGTYLSVNGPTIQDPAVEFSLSQLWVVAGRYNDSSINTVEAGWQTYPNQHPGNSPLAPHLFIYWTADAYKSTGCYNLQCAGFVQTSNKWILGGALAPYTTLAGNDNFEYDLAIFVIYDSTNGGNWWLYIFDEAVGYWPASLYTTLRAGADIIQWGGEVAPSSALVEHTTTVMGSGAFPIDGYPRAAFQRNMTYGDAAGNLFNAINLSRYVTNANCYNSSIQQGSFTNWGTYLFFGGPGGGNPACVKQ